MKRFLSGLMLFIPFFISAGSMEASKENSESRNCEIREEVSDFLNEIMVMSIEQNVCEADQIFVPIPNSSEVYHVCSPEECLKTISNYSDPVGMPIVALIKRGSGPVARSPGIDPSGKSWDIVYDTFSNDQLHLIIEAQIKMYKLSVSDADIKAYSGWTIDQLNNYSISCYNQMFGFVRLAEGNADDICDARVMTSVKVSIGTALGTLLRQGSPKAAVVKGLSAGIGALIVNSYEDFTEMVRNMNMAVKWAKVGDFYSDLVAKRMSQR